MDGRGRWVSKRETKVLSIGKKGVEPSFVVAQGFGQIFSFLE